jgi:hypothetical protein
LRQLREFVTNARLIMTDVPTTTLGLLGGLLYLSDAPRHASNRRAA